MLRTLPMEALLAPLAPLADVTMDLETILRIAAFGCFIGHGWIAAWKLEFSGWFKVGASIACACRRSSSRPAARRSRANAAFSPVRKDTCAQAEPPHTTQVLSGAQCLAVGPARPAGAGPPPLGAATEES